jgi:hypothetical protein
MRIYRCKIFYISGLANEPTPRWPQDYAEPEDMIQQGAGEEALQAAFSYEMSGWTDIGKLWTARVQQDRKRVR